MRITIKEEVTFEEFTLELQEISEGVYKCNLQNIDLIDIDGELTHYDHLEYYDKEEFIKAKWMQFIYNEELKNVNSFCYLD